MDSNITCASRCPNQISVDKSKLNLGCAALVRDSKIDNCEAFRKSQKHLVIQYRLSTSTVLSASNLIIATALSKLSGSTQHCLEPSSSRQPSADNLNTNDTISKRIK